MDVAFHGTVDYGGQGRFTVELIRRVAGLCDRVVLYPTAVSVDEPTEHEWWTGMPANVTVADTAGPLGELWRGVSSFREHDVVHINYATLGLPAVLSRLTGGPPVVYTVHFYTSSVGASVDGWKKRLSWVVDQAMIPFVSRLSTPTTVSEHVGRQLERDHGVSPDVVYHGAPTPVERDGEGRLREFRLDDDAKLLLFVGGFHRFKDPRTVLRAFRRVRLRHDEPVELAMLGGGDRTAELRRTAERLGVDDDTTFVTQLTDELVWEFYDRASVFAFPSYEESFGLVFLEAMTADLPIVHADAGAAPEIVDGAGVAAAPRDPAAFADCILDVLENPEFAATLESGCRERLRDFDWERAAEQYVSIYRKVTDG